MKEKKIVVAIDGYSSTGKSTVAKQLAKKLEYIYVDTGAMYRAVTLYTMRQNWISQNSFDQEALEQALVSIRIRFEINPSIGLADILLNDENVEKYIRKLEVSQHVSQVAAISAVRKKLVALQKEMGKERGVVMDGRDIGTVVFPDAELKIFMTATPEDRAQRRFKEMKERGDVVEYKDVLENVKQRDHIDSTRKDSPLQKAKDAIEIDNSSMSLEEQFQCILQLAKEKITEISG
ncbi:(d)CMP kinase [Aquimarina sp. ERC-38]|uniref:(d)CMP kinase n=1 Tax=Aquimarina sp. ERC-38 TaxID=2949996 RepID=UPI0022459F42|nr:(d)CMP kinase [Aquimarina sp. ERC-38]UZO80223.1 (d)CMP kinase [Aquimarina sp. ERC-38]